MEMFVLDHHVRPRMLALTLTAVLAASSAPSGQPASPHRQTRRLMGTLCEVTVYHADARTAELAAAAGLDEMQRVDRLLSNYDQASELSAMNREAAQAPCPVSEELFAFVERSQRYYEETSGAFDPTVGPLVRTWGFFGPNPTRPPTEAVEAAKAKSGFSKVRLDASARTVSYAAPGLEFDPGGVGKGYAVDRAVTILRERGITAALVSAGGSTLYAIGHPPGRETWRIAIGDPTNVERPIRYVLLRDRGVSTSGVAERSVKESTRRFSHIFDPRTGEPVEGMCQVSVVAPDATASDALTKAAYILAREEVLTLFERLGTGFHALRVEGPCGAGSQVWTTPWSTTVFAAVASNALRRPTAAGAAPD